MLSRALSTTGDVLSRWCPNFIDHNDTKLHEGYLLRFPLIPRCSFVVKFGRYPSLALRELPYFPSFGGSVSPNTEIWPSPATFMRTSSELGK